MIKTTRKVLLLLDKKERAFAIFLVLMMTIGGFLESLSVTVVIPLMTLVMNGESDSNSFIINTIQKVVPLKNMSEHIFVFLILFIIIFILKNVYLIIEHVIQNGFIEKNKLKLQTKIMSAYIRKDYEDVVREDMGVMFRTVTSDTTHADAVLTDVLIFYMEVIVCIALGITMIIISPRITIGIIIALLFALIFLSIFIWPKVKKSGKKGNDAFGTANRWLFESIHGIKSVKTANKENYFEDNFNHYVSIGTKEEKKYFTLNSINKPFCETIAIVGVFIVILFMLSRGAELKDLMPELSAFAVAMVRLLPSINSINRAINSINYHKNGLDNVVNVLTNDHHLDINKEDEDLNDCEEITFNDSLVFKDVSFRYKTNSNLVLDNVSFVIPKGSFVGIVGKSGEGKTTTMDLTLSLLKPTKGTILVDGKDIIKNRKKWLKLVAYVPQNIFLIDDSILKNIAFGEDENKISLDKVSKILKDVQLEEFIKSLPDGINTKVGNNGVRLSGGQIQRIGIARALYFDPELIFFDEATSSLDNETEEAIMQSIELLKGSKTMVMIAHRESSIKDCDIIYSLNKGKISRTR